MSFIFYTRGTFDRKLEGYLVKAFVVQARWINTTSDKKTNQVVLFS
ncbi:MAG: hypothetical protein KBF73_01870 [Flavobacteriales bacterium]|nr:hypothetical protein [Flavobacteriales bacterium]